MPLSLLLLLLISAVSSQYLTPLNNTRCGNTYLWGTIEPTTNCIQSFPTQNALTVTNTLAAGIFDGPSCFYAICAKCGNCAGVSWDSNTGVCSACVATETSSPALATSVSLLKKVPQCSEDAECETSTCDKVQNRCYYECPEPPMSPTCQTHDFVSDEDLVIPDSPVVKMTWDSQSRSFIFETTVLYAREQTSYVLGLDEFIDGRAINQVGLCENRDPDLFTYDNRNWWCSPSDAFGIGSPEFLAWGPSMSWNQTALECYLVKFSRAFTLTDLSKTCSKPGSVIKTTTPKTIQYEGTFHVTLAQEDSDWSLTSLVPLAKWNFPFEFSFTNDYKIVSTLVAQKLSTKVKQGVSVFGMNRLAIFIDTRISDIYGPNAYVVLLSGMDSTNPLVIFPPSTPGKGLVNGPQGTRSHKDSKIEKRALGDDTPCIFPGCQQIWNFLSLPIPDTANFAGVYTATFEVRGSIQNPTRGIDEFTVTITLDPTYVPEKVTEIDNINLGSKLTLFSDSQFSIPPNPSGFRSAETIYASQGIRLAIEDKNLWKLELQKVTICLVVDGTFGCQNAIEKYVLLESGVLQADSYGFSPVIYAPGAVANDNFMSVTGISFKALPLANKKPSSRVFFIEFESLASLNNGQKRFIQQNAKVEETVLLSIKDDPATENQKSGLDTMQMLLIFVPTVIVATALCIIFIFFVLYRKSQKKDEKEYNKELMTKPENNKDGYVGLDTQSFATEAKEEVDLSSCVSKQAEFTEGLDTGSDTDSGVVDLESQSFVSAGTSYVSLDAQSFADSEAQRMDLDASV